MGAEQIRAQSCVGGFAVHSGGRERVERTRTRVVTTVRGALCALGGQGEGVVGGVEMRTLPKSVAGIVERVQLVIGHQRVANGSQDVQVLPIVVVVAVATIAVVVVAATAAAVVGAVAASWTIIMRTEVSLKTEKLGKGREWKKERKKKTERERDKDIKTCSVKFLEHSNGYSLYIKCAIKYAINDLVVSYSLLQVLYHS